MGTGSLKIIPTWIDRWWDPILGFILKTVGKQNSSLEGLNWDSNTRKLKDKTYTPELAKEKLFKKN